MTAFWEVTGDDVRIVTDRHGLDLDDYTIAQINDELDTSVIEIGVSYYTEMDDQQASVLSDIEDHLIANHYLPVGIKKKFNNPE